MFPQRQLTLIVIFSKNSRHHHCFYLRSHWLIISSMGQIDFLSVLLFSAWSEWLSQDGCHCGGRYSYLQTAAMGFLKKLQFWKRKANVSPIMVNSVSTVGPGKCDIGTMREYVIVGRATNSNEAPAVEYAEWCKSYSYGARSEHVGWC